MRQNDSLVPDRPVDLDRQRILTAFEEARVADVRDAMDMCGMHAFGSMQPAIHLITYGRVVGFALTTRYVPFTGVVPQLDAEGYGAWADEYKSTIAPRPWQDDIQPGDVIVIDQCGLDVGVLGSRNTLRCIRNGAIGFVTNGGIRDTDDLRQRKVPVWAKGTAQTMVQGRARFESCYLPVEVGGALVHHGDVIVADGDGVIVVPREFAERVAGIAAQEARMDLEIRRGLEVQM